MDAAASFVVVVVVELSDVVVSEPLPHPIAMDATIVIARITLTTFFFI